MSLRKHTVFMPCDRHAAWFATETRYRRAEVMIEGGPSSPCSTDGKCRMKPGTDCYNATFVAAHPVYTVGEEES